MVRLGTHLFKFGEFQIDPVKRVLLHDCKPVQLPSRAFDVLMALVENNKCVIDKDQLMRLVWGERIVEENNLTRHISTLRKVLDESPSDHRYIVTVPGRGYSFVAEVERVPTIGGQSSGLRRDGDSSAVQLESAVAPDKALEPLPPVDSGHTAEPASKSEPDRIEEASGTRGDWYWTLAAIVVRIFISPTRSPQ